MRMRGRGRRANVKKDGVHVLMCCSDLDRVKGGMVTMVGNLLSYEGWENCRLSYVPTHIEGSKPAKLAYFAAAYLKILGKLMFGGVDVLHLHVSERGSVYRKAALTKLARRFGKGVILHHHGADFDLFYQSLSDKDKAYVVDFLESVDRNLVLSEGVRDAFLQKAPRAKYTVMRNAVKVPPENRYSPEADLIVTMGRLGERKGTYDLLKALRTLDGELPERIKFCLCGDGEVDQVKALVKKYGLEHRVEHIGWVAGAEKDKITARTLCHVLPSYREVLPMSILETMALGIPNISTKIASIPEVITDGEHGLLIEPGDVEALTQALRTLCTDENTRMAMSAASYRLICEEYSVEACSKKLKKVYEEVANGVR